jgi:hypothetical protein
MDSNSEVVELDDEEVLQFIERNEYRGGSALNIW